MDFLETNWQYGNTPVWQRYFFLLLQSFFVLVFVTINYWYVLSIHYLSETPIWPQLAVVWIFSQMWYNILQLLVVNLFWRICIHDARRLFVQIAELTSHTARILGLSMSPDGETVASIGADETMQLWKCFQVILFSDNFFSNYKKGRSLLQVINLIFLMITFVITNRWTNLQRRRKNQPNR